MKNNLKCDFCETNNAVGVYAVDHGPFSSAYCEECFKHPNLRTIFNGLSKWARFGEEAFDECKESNDGHEPCVFLKDEYISLRELVDIITIKDVDEYFKDLKFKSYLTELIREKVIEKKIKIIYDLYS